MTSAKNGKILLNFINLLLTIIVRKTKMLRRELPLYEKETHNNPLICALRDYNSISKHNNG
jgi:hypothetical protein